MKKDFFILIIKNRLTQDISTHIEKFKEWLIQNTPLNPIIEAVDTINYDFTYGDPFYWSPIDLSLEGAKPQLIRDARRKIPVEDNAWDAVFVFDDRTSDQKTLYAWCAEPEKFAGEAVLITCPINNYEVVFRHMTHEIIHAFMHNLFWYGQTVVDDMDLYDRDDDIYAPNGNRARNLARITDKFWEYIGELPKKRQLIVWLKRVISLMTSVIAKKDAITKWAEAVRAYEGWKVGSRSYRNSNPGNLKYTKLTVELGAYTSDIDGFAIFKDELAGMTALKKFLTYARDGNLIGYRPDGSLYDFFKIYAPASDRNEPIAYAQFVARRIGVSPDTQIRDIG